MTDLRWDVFISHSTSPAPEGVAARLLEELLEWDALPAWRVRADREFLHLGDRWQERIREVVNESNVGVVLLDENALRSKWVRRETRQMIDRGRDFRVIPVLIGLTRADVEEAGCEEFTELVRDRHNIVVRDDGQVVLDELGTLLGTEVMAALTPEEMSWVQRIAYYLPEDERMLANALRRFDPVRDLPPLLPRERLAYRILESRLHKVVKALFVFLKHDLVKRLRPESRAMLAELIEPSWIESSLARRIPPHTPSQVCVLSTGNPVPKAQRPGVCVDTGVHLVRRATCWDEENVEVRPCGDVPVGDPSEIPLHLGDQYQWEEDVKNYIVLEAGRNLRSRLDTARAVRDLWPDVVVVLVVDPGTDPVGEKFDQHLGPYGTVVIEHREELEANKAMDKIREVLRIEKAGR
ncbi:toll/interleukin-1 receptor domain-containing protein [Lentzea chajnantorensis]